MKLNGSLSGAEIQRDQLQIGSTANVEMYRQPIGQLAHVQEQQMGWSSSRSPVLASRENRDYQRATGPICRASFSTGGYRGLNLTSLERQSSS
jgi:hypothetical protein